MAFNQLSLARADAAAAGAFLVISAVVIYEGVKLGPGWGESGPDAGFFPFSLAVLMGAGSIAVLVELGLNRLRGRTTSAFFEDREEITELARVGLPIVAAIAAIPVLGLYITAALYIWLFAWWHGQFRWYTSLLSGLIFASALFALLDLGFRILMPQSVWYGTYLPF